MWFRLELDNTGAILSCTEVELAERQNRFVRFVEARDKAEACTSVKQWYERHRQRRRDGDRLGRSLRLMQGKCARCKQPAAPGLTVCESHRVKENSARKERRRNPRPKADPMTPQLAYLVHHEPQLRASRVLYEFDKRGPEGFRDWLVALLRDRLAGLKVA